MAKLSSLPVVSIWALFRVGVRASKITWFICLTYIPLGSSCRVLKGIGLITLAIAENALEGKGEKVYRDG